MIILCHASGHAPAVVEKGMDLCACSSADPGQKSLVKDSPTRRIKALEMYIVGSMSCRSLIIGSTILSSLLLCLELPCIAFCNGGVDIAED